MFAIVILIGLVVGVVCGSLGYLVGREQGYGEGWLDHSEGRLER